MKWERGIFTAISPFTRLGIAGIFFSAWNKTKSIIKGSRSVSPELLIFRLIICSNCIPYPMPILLVGGSEKIFKDPFYPQAQGRIGAIILQDLAKIYLPMTPVKIDQTATSGLDYYLNNSGD